MEALRRERIEEERGGVARCGEGGELEGGRVDEGRRGFGEHHEILRVGEGDGRVDDSVLHVQHGENPLQLSPHAGEANLVPRPRLPEVPPLLVDRLIPQQVLKCGQFRPLRVLGILRLDHHLAQSGEGEHHAAEERVGRELATVIVEDDGDGGIATVFADGEGGGAGVEKVVNVLTKARGCEREVKEKRVVELRKKKRVENRVCCIRYVPHEGHDNGVFAVLEEIAEFTVRGDGSSGRWRSSETEAFHSIPWLEWS